MMERRRRLVMWGIMFLLMVLFFIKGHGPVQKEGPVAFLHENARPVTIRISGNIANPGIYTLSPDANIGTVTKMTLPDCELKGLDKRLLDRILQDGDIVELRPGIKQVVDITVKKMQAGEMVVLGLPLDPNLLMFDDWVSLPGIGPALALRIVQDRQINGDFKSFEDLQRVPGIGEGKIRQLAEYF